MGKFNLWWILRDLIGGIGWKMFIRCLGVSQEKYWQVIYEQELARKSEESAATSSNTGSPKLPAWCKVEAFIRGSRNYEHEGAVLIDIAVAKNVYDFIGEQLRAGA